jgi:hypothetical protein
VAATPGPFAAFSGEDLAYALDDGMPFPGWAPSLLGDDEAQKGYEAGERIAVLAGDPADPAAGLVLDRGNARLAVRCAEPPLQLVHAGAELPLAEAIWRNANGLECWARRVSSSQLRIARRPPGAPLWVEQLLAYAPADPAEQLRWPAFGDWGSLDSGNATPWIGEGALQLIDADGWILDALEGAGVPQQWRALGRQYDAPRAFGLPPEVQAKLAEPLGWVPAGRRWRKADEVSLVERSGQSAVIVTDAMFAAGAGASGEIMTSVTVGSVEVAVDLPSVTARCEVRSGSRLGSPSHPRPSTGAQVAVTAMLETGGVAHDAVVTAVRAGKVPAQWFGAFGGDA